MEQERLKRIFIGNPGVGKSTLLNSLVGELAFHSGWSSGKGLTEVFAKHQAGGISYCDTPGLADNARKEAAGKEISKVLKQGGNVQIVFVMTLESGRIRPQEVATMKIVLDAAPEIKNNYGIIINKCTDKQIIKLSKAENWEDLITYLFYGISKENQHETILLMKNLEDLADEDDVFITDNEQLEKSGLNQFMFNKVSKVHLTKDEANDLKVDTLHDLIEKLERKDNELKNMEQQLRENLIEKTKILLDKEREAKGLPFHLSSLAGMAVDAVCGAINTGLTLPGKLANKGGMGSLDYDRGYKRKGVDDLSTPDGTGDRPALIILQALGIKFPPNVLMKKFATCGLGVSENCIIEFLQAPNKGTLAFPPSWHETIGFKAFRSWFYFNQLPANSVTSEPGIVCESKEDLEDSLEIVESKIEELMKRGVQRKNIVLMGFSQGAALTIYAALHTKYKIGGFIAALGWLPLRKIEPIAELTPVNKETPILQVNGKLDFIVAHNPAATKTASDLEALFGDRFQFYTSDWTDHATTMMVPSTINTIKKWIKSNTNIANRN